MKTPDLIRQRSLLLSALFVAGLSAAPAQAQLDLPKPKAEPEPEAKENTAERLLRLGETPRVARPSMSRASVSPGAAKRDARAQQRGGSLDLPSRRRPRRAGDRAREVAPQPASQPPVVVPGGNALPASPAGTPSEAEMSLRERALGLLKSIEEINLEDGLIRETEEKLVALGEDGLYAARVGLAAKEAPVLLVSARVLLRSADTKDAARVEALLGLSLPRRAVGPLLRSFVELAPVRSTPELMAELLCHDQSPMRQAAQASLEPLLQGHDMAVLDRALEHKRSDARMRAVELLALHDTEESTDRLLERVSDGTPKVARLAIDTLSRRGGARIDHELLERTFAERWVLKSSAYALLAIVEREDQLLRSILDERHVEPLLRGLTSGDLFVRGSCATALAGIGFRSEDPRTTPWLDREVPDALLTSVASQEFFAELSTLRAPATRRMAMISGVNYGADAPAWAGWWLSNREHFRASRAVLRVSPEDITSLHILVQPGPDEGGLPRPGFQLAGPALEASDLRPDEGEVFYLTHDEMGQVLELADEEGLLDVRRLPGTRGTTIDGIRRIELRIAGQAKAFVFGLSAREDWFERMLAVTVARAERNAWQRFPIPGVYGSRSELWQDQREWWLNEEDGAARAARLEGLALQFAEKEPAGRRALAFQQLRELWSETPGLRQVEDGERLLKLLDREVYYGAEARQLTELITQVSGFEDEAKPEVGDPRRGTMERLLDVLYERFDVNAGEQMMAVLANLGRERIRGAAQDRRPLLRAMSSSLLPMQPEAEDIEALLDLLQDPDTDVRIAAIQAAGEGRVEEARESLLEISREAPRAQRLAALPALGRLGGADVRGVLTRAMGEPEEDVKAAAAEGLAELGDPSTSYLLVSQLIRRGRNSPAFPAVRRALLGMGDEAVPDLMTALRSGSPDGRRESALLLSQLGEPIAASALLALVTDDPTDRTSMRELAVLSCLDYSKEGDPPAAWWRWWDGVRREDAFLWFESAMALRGIEPIPREEFENGGSREAVSYLMEGMRRKEDWLSERARRELVKMTDSEIQRDLPKVGADRDLWLETMFEVLAQSRQ